MSTTAPTSDSALSPDAGGAHASPLLPRDHWVSKGYQRGFASSDQRVAVMDVSGRKIVDPRRPTKSNFAEVGFTTFVDGDEVVNELELAFARIEKKVLNQIRDVSSSRRGSDLQGAVANLFAIHLVRSPSFKAFGKRIEAHFRGQAVDDLAADERLPEMFQKQFGRPPLDGELRSMVEEQCDKLLDNPHTPAGSMARQHDAIAEKLCGFHMQVIEVDPTLPGLVLGDTPIVHADLATRRYGFRDSLAIGDASLIIGPLTRRTAVCFTATRLPPVTITTHKALDALNAVFIRAAVVEVACHPDDARRLQQLSARLDRHPPHQFLERHRRAS